MELSPGEQGLSVLHDQGSDRASRSRFRSPVQAWRRNDHWFACEKDCRVSGSKWQIAQALACLPAPRLSCQVEPCRIHLGLPLSRLGFQAWRRSDFRTRRKSVERRLTTVEISSECPART